VPLDLTDRAAHYARQAAAKAAAAEFAPDAEIPNRTQ